MPAIAAETRALADLLARSRPERVAGPDVFAVLAALDARLLAHAEAHGVAPLLADRLGEADLTASLAPGVRAALEGARRGAVLLEAVQTPHMVRVLGALVAAGVAPIVFKGAALAVTHYRASWLRPHSDVDLLVPPEQAALAGAILERQGCRKAARPEGALVTYQTRFLGAAGAVDCAYDLHWRVADPQLFGHLFDYESLRAEGVSGPVAGALMPGPVHALLIACVHRVAHHFDTDRLLLLWDIDRIARGLTTVDWERFVALAEAGGIRAVCLRGVDLAARLLDTPVPPEVRARLAAGVDEPSARFVGGTIRRVDVLRSDMARLPGWKARLTLVREHLFPSPAYMAARYGVERSWLLPVLYVDRVLRGVGGWFRPVQ